MATKVSFESPAALEHVRILQGIISRMAHNSEFIKLVFTLMSVAAFIASVWEKEFPEALFVGVAGVLAFLDAYYLALERSFRAIHSNFCKNLQSERVSEDSIFYLIPHKPTIGKVLSAFLSPAVWPFYTAITAFVVLS